MLGSGTTGTAHVGLVGVRLQRNGFAGCYTRRAQGTCDRKTSTNSSRDLFRKFLAVGWRQRVLSFVRVREKSAFHKHCRNCRFSQHVITAAAHSTVRRRRASCDKIMDGGGERQAVAAIEIRFDSVGANPCCRVKMNTDENAVLI